MRNEQESRELDWLHPFRRRLIIGLAALLTASVAATLVFLSITLRICLIKDSTVKTKELGAVIEASLIDHMMTRDPQVLQHAFDGLREDSSIQKAFIIDRSGRIAYSTDRREIGKRLDRFHEPSCLECHGPGKKPEKTAASVSVEGHDVQRVVKVIYNRPACYSCHPDSQKINGKLIIDRPMTATRNLITTVVFIVVVFGAICLGLVIPFVSRYLSRGMNTYITEIQRQDAERSLLYAMMERLSKTIDMHELEGIIIEIVRDTFGPEEVDLVLTRDGRETRAIAWAEGQEHIVRKPIDGDKDLAELVERWNAGGFSGGATEIGNQRIVFPVGKADRRFALVIARKLRGNFDTGRMRLVRALASHVAVALENAYLYYIAITDELTRLFTQRHFRSSIQREFSEFQLYGKKMALLMIDLDNFKGVNDAYGHPAGDSVLKGTAGLLLKAIRDNDFAFRYGGEEFAVILSSTGRKGGMHVAERIRRAVREARFDVQGGQIGVTVSIGLASWPEHADSIKDVILAADTALYEAKRGGKDRVVVASPKG